MRYGCSFGVPTNTSVTSLKQLTLAEFSGEYICKKCQRRSTGIFIFSKTFGLANSSLNSAKLSTSSDVMLTNTNGRLLKENISNMLLSTYHIMIHVGFKVVDAKYSIN